MTDFVMQTKKSVENKVKLSTNLLHGFILLIVSSVIFIDILDFRILLMLVFISVLHSAIDYLKARFSLISHSKRDWLIFAGDQILHVLTIIVAILFFYPSYGYTLFQETILLTGQAEWFKIAFFFILITAGGSYFTASVCKRFTSKLDQGYSLENAGQYIGVLERIVIAASILIGRYELIGFLIAAKSIIRHNTDRDRAFTEYFLIGTLTSFLWAAVFTYLFILFS